MTWAALGLLVVGISPAAGDSILLPEPPELGSFESVTYDGAGRRLGESALVLERHGDGKIRGRLDTSAGDTGRMQASVLLEPTAGGLRLLHEESQSYAGRDRAFPLLHVDHVAGVATCTPAPGSGQSFRRIDLPPDERIVNVPLNLFFLPLVRGQVDELEFQIFVCARGGRVIDFVAHATERTGADGRPLIEVRYRPDLGPFSWLASPLVPDLAFWFDRGGGGRYVAHRIPLHPDGPVVLVAGLGVTPQDLGVAR
jgi:hypothetical protein